MDIGIIIILCITQSLVTYGVICLSARRAERICTKVIKEFAEVCDTVLESFAETVNDSEWANATKEFFNTNKEQEQ